MHLSLLLGFYRQIHHYAVHDRSCLVERHAYIALLSRKLTFEHPGTSLFILRSTLESAALHLLGKLPDIAVNGHTHETYMLLGTQHHTEQGCNNRS